MLIDIDVTQHQVNNNIFSDKFFLRQLHHLQNDL